MNEEMLDQRAKILELTAQFSQQLLAEKKFTPGEDAVPVSGKVLTPEDFVKISIIRKVI